MFWLGAIWLLLWNGLKWWPGDQWWPVALTSYLAPWIALISLLVIAATWFTRQRALSLALLSAVFLIGIRLLPLFFFKSPAPIANHTPLEVMTFNVNKHNKDSAGILAIIVEENPDIVALQELLPSLADHLVQALEKRYPYHTLQADQFVRGQGLFSRYPLEQVSRSSDYRYQSAIVQTPQGAITLLNVHTPTLSPSRWTRQWKQQRDFIRTLVAQADNVGGPLLIVGDFNTTGQSENYDLIHRHLQDAFLESGWGFGFSYPATGKLGLPWSYPLVRIDYIFYNEHFVSHDTRVLKENGGSDHRPVVSTLSLLH